MKIHIKKNITLVKYFLYYFLYYLFMYIKFYLTGFLVISMTEDDVETPSGDKG
jgi:hypothetical protein